MPHDDSFNGPRKYFLHPGSSRVAVHGGKAPQFALSQLFVGARHAKDQGSHPARGLVYIDDQVGNHQGVGRLVKEHHFVNAASVDICTISRVFHQASGTLVGSMPACASLGCFVATPLVT